jgi:hypothetical protein
VYNFTLTNNKTLIANFTINTPEITAQPQTQTLQAGSTLLLNISTTGTDLNYQ